MLCGTWYLVYLAIGFPDEPQGTLDILFTGKDRLAGLYIMVLKILSV